MIFLIASISAFELEKQLVQLEVDENYPCHIENGNEIVCPALTQIQINNWKDKIESIPKQIDDGKGKLIDNPQADLGKITDSQKSNYLVSKKTLYSGKVEKEIDITKEYREKVNVYSLDKEIRIGFATNVFGVASTPLENFDVNTTTGMVRYRPLNMTYGYLSSSQRIGRADSGSISSSNYSISLWINTNSSSGTIFQMLSNNIIKISNGLLNVSCNETSSLNPTLNISDNLWHNLIVIKLGGNLSLYSDGLLINSTDFINCKNGATSSGIYIGSGSSNTIGYYDEFRLYWNTTANSILAYENVSEVYSSGRKYNNSLQSNFLWAYIPIKENSGASANDYSVNSRNFTLSSLTLWRNDGINVTTLGYDVNISIANISNALIYYNNNTLVNYSETSNRTFTFRNNQTVFILENFNVTDGVSRENSPIWFSFSNDTSKHIASNLSNTISTKVILDISCDTSLTHKLNKITYTTETGVVTTWEGDEALLVCTNLTTVGQTVDIDPASGSNEFDMEYVDLVCTKMTNTSFTLVMLFASLIIVLFGGYMVKKSYENGTLSIGSLVTFFIALIVCIVLWLASGQNLGSSCPVS